MMRIWCMQLQSEAKQGQLQHSSLALNSCLCLSALSAQTVNSQITQ